MRPPPRKPANSARPGKPPAARPLDQTAALMGALFGHPGEETSSLQAVFRALGQPDKQVVVELRWYADGSPHQIVLKSRAGNRVVFFNPQGNGGKPPGTVLTDGLKRRIEPDGTQSCELADLEQVFRQGHARALIT